MGSPTEAAEPPRAAEPTEDATTHENDSNNNNNTNNDPVAATLIDKDLKPASAASATSSASTEETPAPAPDHDKVIEHQPQQSPAAPQTDPEKPAHVENTAPSDTLEKKETLPEDEASTAKPKPADEEDEEHEGIYISGLPLVLLTFGLCMAIFVIALDNTIIATAIPKITTVFNSLEDVGWYGSAYLLTTTSLQPSFGKIFTYFNVKWTFLLALCLFEVGSIICAAATSSVMFIIGRAVAGAGAAAIFSGGLTIVAFSVPLRKRAIYIASLSSMFGISSVVGPILGGALTDKASWRWCFWINLPVGGIALAAVFFFFKNPDRELTHMSTKEKLKQIDILGAFFLIAAIVCLLLALQWGGFTYPWGDSKVWGTLLGFGLLISCFIGIQIWRGELATLPPRIIVKQRTVLACAWFTAFLSMALYTHIYYLPFYFQAGKGTTAEGSGIRCIAYLISTTIGSIVVGGLITVLGYYSPFLWAGAAIFTVGCGLLTTLKLDSSAGVWIGYQVLAGLGAGACVQIPFVAVQVVLNERDMPTGNAIAIFFNSLGGAISISAAQNVFVNALSKNLPRYAPGVDPILILAAGATHIRDFVPADQLRGVLEAYVNAVTKAFYLPIATAGVAFFFSLLVEWKSVKGKKLLPTGGA